MTIQDRLTDAVASMTQASEADPKVESNMNALIKVLNLRSTRLRRDQRTQVVVNLVRELDRENVHPNARRHIRKAVAALVA